MAKEDELLTAFLNHRILVEKYKISASDLPKTIEDGMKSTVPIIAAITNIVKGIQRRPIISDNELQKQVIDLINRKG